MVPADVRRQTATAAIRAVLARVAILAIAAGSAGPAFAQATGDAPAAPADAPAAPTPGPRDGKVLQDWTLHCQLPQPQQEICEMRHWIVGQNGARVGLAVVGRPPNTDDPGLLILLPLGISLPPGTFLKIDQGEERRVPVERCERQGCHIELLLDDDLLPRMRAGTQAFVTFHVNTNQGQRLRVDAPISLMGFSAALAEVMK
jgi:invasion protein IalB